MSHFHTTTKVPVRRLLFYWIMAVASAGWIGSRQGDHKLVFVVAILAPVLTVLMLAAYRFGRSPLARRHAQVILWLYIFLQTILIVWDIVTGHRR